MNDIPIELINKIQQRKIVVFVGAGLSVSLGMPNWKQLVINILQQLKDKEPKAQGYIDALNRELLEPIEVLGKIESLKTDVIRIFEKEIKKFRKHLKDDLHEKIGKISSKVITTNYDDFLESNLPYFEKIVYTNSYKLSQMSNYSSYILKIHGDIEEPDKCILFPSQYENLYSSSENCPIFELKKIFSDNSLLFIGFGLNDPYINYTLKYINNLYSGFSPDHYIITIEKDNKWGDKIIPLLISDYRNAESLIDYLLTKKEQPIKTELENKIINYESDESKIVDASIALEYDTPPDIKYWVGRKKIIENISNENFRVICITGIGGQGKSALAAYYLKNKFGTKLYEFADWRDFKEETNRFQTKLISIVRRLTNNKLDKKNIEELDNKQLVDLFFVKLEDRKIIFVFDNIDSYINLECFFPSGEMGYLFTESLNRNHNSKFIFTCRPFIKEAGSGFYQIQLQGLDQDETLELFNLYKISAKKTDIEILSKKAHSVTKGHPLWLNLIAAQSCRGIKNANDFLANIENRSSFDEDNFAAILSQKILSQIWDTLNQKQKNFLRGIAETVKPETIENLKKILSSELNNNQFNKSFKALKGLNLIELKKSAISQDLIELHPLVKEFILSKYQKTEREKYITLLVKFYDSFIFILKPKLSSELTLYEYSYWTSNVELLTNKGDFTSSLIALEEVSHSILAAGYIEEYLRVSEKLFDAIDWHDAVEREYPYFHKQIREVIRSLIQFGNFSRADDLLHKYEKIIPEKNNLYLGFCSLQCYFYWFQQNFEKAISVGEQGEYLLARANLADDYNLRHNLALSRRDSKDKNKIEQALLYFLKTETLEIVVDISVPISFDGHFYGNIGRCLEFLGDNDKALICYIKSLYALLTEKNKNDTLNIGYACFWISGILITKGQIQNGLYFLKNAIISSDCISPPRSKIYRDYWDSIVCDADTKRQIDSMLDWKIEKYCKQKIENFLNLGS
jgi:hypothetical protein